LLAAQVRACRCERCCPTRTVRVHTCVGPSATAAWVLRADGVVLRPLVPGVGRGRTQAGAGARRRASTGKRLRGAVIVVASFTACLS